MAFYKLQVGERSFIEGGSGNNWAGVICLKNPGHQRAGPRTTVLRLDVLSWNVVDFSRTMLSDVVITDHARNILHDAALTGFLLKPTEVIESPPRVDRSNFPRLWEFVVTGQGGPAHEDSGIENLWNCDECGLVRYSAYEHGIVVNDETYDGSDFFTVAEYPNHILVSERAKAVIENGRLTNVSFVESSSLKWPEGVIKPT
jgi:hypothetical protein